MYEEEYKMELKILDILQAIEMDYEVIGENNEVCIESPASLGKAGRNQLTFCSDESSFTANSIESSNAGLVICPRCVDKEIKNKVLVVVDNPQLAFMRVLSKFFDVKKTGVSKTAIIDKDAVVHKSVYIGPSVCICSGVHIGKNVIIQPHCTIGTEGFGHIRNKEGVFERFPQLGGVIIEDDVEIGPQTNIQRGTLEDTILRNGSKIGHHCNIGHNSEIGKHTFVAGSCCFAGSTKIGDFSWIGIGVVVIDRIRIGDNVMIGGGSLVVKDIEDNWLAYGTPAKTIRKRRGR